MAVVANRQPHHRPLLRFGLFEQLPVRGGRHENPLPSLPQSPLCAPLERLTASVGKGVHLIKYHQIKIPVKAQRLVGGGNHKGRSAAPFIWRCTSVESLDWEPGKGLPQALCQLLHHRTAGNGKQHSPTSCENNFRCLVGNFRLPCSAHSPQKAALAVWLLYELHKLCAGPPLGLCKGEGELQLHVSRRVVLPPCHGHNPCAG